MLGWLGTANLPLGAHVALDVRVAVAAAAATIALAVVMALPIAWYYLREHGLPALNAESRGSTASRGAERMRRAFLIAQITTAFVLVSSAGLLAVSLDKAMAVSPGFRAGNVLTGLVSLRSANFQRKQDFMGFIGRLAERLEREPGVTAAGISTNVPFSGTHNKSAAVAEGATAAGVPLQGIYSYGVTGNYFAALGIPLIEGRFLTADDSARPARVVVVDEHFARRNWPGASAIGKRLFQGGGEGRGDQAFTVVGVVGAVKQAAVTEDDRAGAVFYPFNYQWDSSVFVIARAALPAAALAPALRRAVRDLNQDLPVDDVMTMEERIEVSMVGRRSPAAMAVVFAAIAALLAAIGTYGVLSYAVAQRRREIGLRMALGAQPGQVRARFLGVALRALGLGGVLGLAGAWAAGQAMQSLLYGVSGMPPAVLAGAAAVLVLVALPACLLPAVRAARVSPLEVLNS
jgi:predicted permease